MQIRLYLVVWFMVSTTTSAQQETHQEIPPELLFKKNQQSRFSISPDGKYFAEIITNNNEVDLVIIDIDDYKMYQRIPLDRSKLNNVYWLSNNRLLYESAGQIHAIDKDGTNLTVLVNNQREVKKKNTYVSYFKRFLYNKVLSILPNEEDQILVEAFDFKGYASVNKINVFTGEKKEIISGAYHKMNGWYLDSSGKPIIGIKEDDTSWTYYVEDKALAKWVPLKIVLDGEEHLFEINADSYLKQHFTFQGVDYEKNTIYITSNINSDKRELYKYDLEKRKVIDTIAKDVNCDITDPDGKRLRLIFDSLNKELAGVRYEGIMPEYHWTGQSFKSKFQEVQKKHPNHFNDILDFDDKQERFLVKQWSDTYAGNVGVYDNRDSTYRVMFHFNEELNKYKLSRTKNIAIKNRSDIQLLGYLNLPVRPKDSTGLMPLITIPHGGPWARDYWELDGFSQYFASKGFAVLRINFQGSTGFGKTHILGGLQSIDNVMINDIADATTYIKENYEIDPNNVFIFGHSYGGYAAYMSLIKYGDVFKSGVALSAPTDIKLWMKGLKKKDANFALEFWDTALGGRDSKYLSEISPINYVDKIKSPMMVFHGKYDKTVPVEQAEKMKKKFEALGKKDKFSILQNEGHTIWDSNSIGYILKQASEFFQGNK